MSKRTNNRLAEPEDRIQTVHDEKSRIIVWRDTRLELPAVDIFDEPTRCYQINKQWASVVMGMVSWLTEIAAWYDAQDDTYSGILQVSRFLVGSECDNMAFQLRQNPDNLCVLQQSLDNGATWADVFDFSLCLTIQDKSYQVQIQNQVTYVQPTFEAIYNNYVANYAGNPQSVYPALENPTGDNSALRAAYCNALYEFISICCRSAVSYYIESVNQTQNEINVALGVSAFLLAAISLAGAIPTAGASLAGLAPAAALWAAGISLGAVFGNSLVDFWQQHTIEQFRDTTAIEDVTCYLFDEISVEDNSLQAMRDALDVHPLTGNAGVIADFVSIMLGHDSTYAAFLEKWNNNKQYADVGIELYCPCLTGYQVWVWDFANGKGDFEIADFFGGGNVGVFANGRVEGTGTNDIKILSIAYNNFNPSWRVRGVKLHLERVNGATGQGNNDSAVQLRPTPNSETGNTQIIGGQNEVDGEFIRCNNIITAPFYDDGTNQLYIFSRITHTLADPPVQVYLHKIEIEFVQGYSRGGYITDDDNICT